AKKLHGKAITQDRKVNIREDLEKKNVKAKINKSRKKEREQKKKKHQIKEKKQIKKKEENGC
ncbi:12818_t:CDS:1, partial [Gigaspora margarita]